mgnify:CR=1 FL=1
MTDRFRDPRLILRLGLAFVFIYAASGSLITPSDWIGYLPLWVRDRLPGELLLQLFAIYELLLAAWLLSGWRLFWSATLTALTLAGIVFSTLGAFVLVFRAAGLLAAATALAFLARGEESK